MAYDGAKQPLGPGLLDPTPQTNQKKAPKRMRYRRCKSAPLVDNVHDVIDQFAHCESSVGKFIPSFRVVVIFLALYLGVGTVFFYLLRHQMKGKKTNGVLDAVYFCIVTMATVGYGDLVPNSVLTKLLACAFVFTGMALVGIILIKSADYLVEKQGMMLVKALHKDQKASPTEKKETKSQKIKYKCVVVLIVLLVLVIFGTIFLALVEEMNLVDAFYCVCSTITTLGYGDKSFSTRTGRVFAVFWILTSTNCLAQFFLYIAELSTESRQRALVKRVLTHFDLEAADLNRDGVVSEAEFIIYKLQEMGKICEEDISLVRGEFKDLDVDRSGTLSAFDIMKAQSSETGRR